MFKYEQVEENYRVVKEFTHAYRKELTVFQGAVSQVSNLISCSDYVKFNNKLSDDEYIGVMMFGLLNEPCIDLYKKILNSEKTFEYLLDTYLTNEERKIYDENIGE